MSSRHKPVVPVGAQTRKIVNYSMLRNATLSVSVISPSVPVAQSVMGITSVGHVNHSMLRNATPMSVYLKLNPAC